ncbi:hypothetical protein BFG60_1115 [Microcystis aeruginosa NIES-98]|nr:hypothetical protein BFG60_1115 [Microcystis aeruginosa NIES-98]
MVNPCGAVMIGASKLLFATVRSAALTCPCGTITKKEDAIAILNNPSLLLPAKDINFANIF